MDSWWQLMAELDRWHQEGRMVTLWWRDDDAVVPTPALDRLLALHARYHVPLALAVIPAGAGAALAERLEPYPRIAVLQHGYAHKNHAGEGERAIEMGGPGRRRRAGAELREGSAALRACFGARLLPVIVPPWNRVAEEIVPDLAPLGFRALSRFAPRARREAAAGLLETNCHVDLIDWRGGRRFRGVDSTLAQLRGHLTARREGGADAAEPSGILTHHLVHDEDCWRFLEALLERCHDHPGVRWLDAGAACLAP